MPLVIDLKTGKSYNEVVETPPVVTPPTVHGTIHGYGARQIDPLTPPRTLPRPLPPIAPGRPVLPYVYSARGKARNAGSDWYVDYSRVTNGVYAQILQHRESQSWTIEIGPEDKPEHPAVTIHRRKGTPLSDVLRDLTEARRNFFKVDCVIDEPLIAKLVEWEKGIAPVAPIVPTPTMH